PAYRRGETLKADITLENEAGHRFPTGDSLHSGILDVCLKDGGRTLGRQAFVLTGRSRNDILIPVVGQNGKRRSVEQNQVFPGAAEPHGARLHVPSERDTRLIPGKPETVTYTQPISAAI